MLDHDAIVRAALKRLDEAAGPVDLQDLAESVGDDLGIPVDLDADAYRQDGTLSDVLSVDLLDELLLEEPDVHYLDRDRVVLLRRVLDGLTLTCRPTAEEITADALEFGFDLLPLMFLDDAEGIALADGGRAEVRTPRKVAAETGFDPDAAEERPEEWRLAGPDGWLAGLNAGELIGVRAGPEGLELLGSVEEDEDATQRAVVALRQVAEGGPLADDAVEGGDLVLESRVAEPSAFSAPTLPLTELVERAGLETHGDFVARAGFDWDGWFQERRFAAWAMLIARRHGLDREQARAVAAVVDVAVGHRDGDEDVRDPGPLATAGLIMRHPSLAVATFVEVAATPGMAVTALLQPDEAKRFFTDVQGALEPMPGAPTAGVTYALALVADLDADPMTAQRLLHDTVAEDPGFGPAWYDLAEYAADAGDAIKARDHLRRLEKEAGVDMPEDDPFVGIVEEYARPGPTAAARNEPCPCGSGRKHKVCCGPHNGWPLVERVQWVLGHLVAYSRRPHTADLTNDLIERCLASDLYGPSSDVDGRLAIFLAIFDAGLVDDYRRERGRLLPADESELLDLWQDVRVGHHEVVALEPGDGLEVLDLTTGERAAVRERTASRQLRVGDQLLCHLVPVPGDRHQLTGAVRKVASHERESLAQVVGRRRGETDPFELATWLAAAARPRPTSRR